MEGNQKFKSHVNVSSYAKEVGDKVEPNQNQDDEEAEFKPTPLSKKGNSTNLRGFLTSDLKDKLNDLDKQKTSL